MSIEDAKQAQPKTYEKLDKRINPEYFQQAIDSIEWPVELKGASYYSKLSIALICQNNLLMSRMFDMLAIACGLADDPDISSEAPDISMDDQIKQKMKQSTICGQCGQGVIPDRMGYCPKCHNDLKTQIAQELINQG